MGIARMQTTVPYSMIVHGELRYEFEDEIKEFIKSSFVQELLKTRGIPIEYYDKLTLDHNSCSWVKDMMMMEYHPKNATNFIITDIELEDHFMKVTVDSMTKENMNELDNLRVSCAVVSKDEEGKVTIHFLHFVI